MKKDAGIFDRMSADCDRFELHRVGGGEWIAKIEIDKDPSEAHGHTALEAATKALRLLRNRVVLRVKKLEAQLTDARALEAVGNELGIQVDQ